MLRCDADRLTDTISQPKRFIRFQELLHEPTAKQLFLHQRVKAGLTPTPLQPWAISAPSVLNIWSARSTSNKAAFVPEPRSGENSPLSSEQPARKAAAGLLQQGSAARQQGSRANSGQRSQAAATEKHYLLRSQGLKNHKVL